MAPGISQVALPQTAKEKLITQIYADPGLPRSNPTLPAWQHPMHELSHVQSPRLAQTADYVIIGSGITGLGVAKALLERSGQERTVVVLEARTLLDGATSRNAGFLFSSSAAVYADMADTYGEEEARRIVAFCQRNLQGMHRLIDESPKDIQGACERRQVRCVSSFADEAGLAQRKARLQRYELAFPEQEGCYSIIDKDGAEKTYQLKGVAGAVSVEGHVCWPYRLLTSVFKVLHETYQSRLSIETRTPVTSVIHSPETETEYPYIISTARGIIRAKHVFHCTNAFASHLVPQVRGKIYPHRLVMSTMRPGPKVPNEGDKLCWIFYRNRSLNASTGSYDMGMSWMQQNAATGKLYFGGGSQNVNHMITSDDTKVPTEPENNLGASLPPHFRDRWDGVDVAETEHAWSGIIGRTPDAMPLVGAIRCSAEADSGEWIAAGFNGYGMSLCLSSGEAIARMALQEGVPDWLPKPFLITPARMDDMARMGPEAAVRALL